MVCRFASVGASQGFQGAWHRRPTPKALRAAAAQPPSGLLDAQIPDEDTKESLFARVKSWWKLIPVEKEPPITASEALSEVWGLTKGVRVWVLFGTMFLVCNCVSVLS